MSGSLVEVVDHSVEVLDHSVEVLDHSVEVLDHSVEVLDHSVEVLDHSVEILDHSVEVLDHSVEVDRPPKTRMPTLGWTTVDPEYESDRGVRAKSLSQGSDMQLAELDWVLLLKAGLVSSPRRSM